MSIKLFFRERQVAVTRFPSIASNLSAEPLGKVVEDRVGARDDEKRQQR